MLRKTVVFPKLTEAVKNRFQGAQAQSGLENDAVGGTTLHQGRRAGGPCGPGRGQEVIGAAIQ